MVSAAAINAEVSADCVAVPCTEPVVKVARVSLQPELRSLPTVAAPHAPFVVDKKKEVTVTLYRVSLCVRFFILPRVPTYVS